jgi:predicted amidohydrolase
MRICVYQGAATFLDVEGNLAQMERIAKAAAAQGAQLALFPELFLCGYNLGSDAARVADSVDGQSTRRAAGIARRHDIALLYGYAGGPRHTSTIRRSSSTMRGKLVPTTARCICSDRTKSAFSRPATMSSWWIFSDSASES